VQGISKKPFGVTARGEEVSCYTLTNRRDSVARWIDWGATLTELWIPDRAGVLGDVVLGFDSLEAYERNEPHVGCVIGRVANRIAGARFTLDGVDHPLAANREPNHLHGGWAGFDKALWIAEPLDRLEGPALRFTHTSPDGDEGYPGTLRVELIVTLDHEDALHFEYRAETDAPTPVNLTHHDYWNLAGHGDILSHELLLHADRYTETGEGFIPTGRQLPVAGTPFDFRVAKPVGRDIGQLERGYDQNYVLAEAVRDVAVPAGELFDPSSGRRMTFSTSEPGVQLYTGNFLDGVVGKHGAVHGRHDALCLETQHFPDAVHQPSFPSIVLRPGETYRQVTVYAFGTD
jgi:aldose 1-epimerase